jgi:hypothetical protein
VGSRGVMVGVIIAMAGLFVVFLISVANGPTDDPNDPSGAGGCLTGENC